LIKLQKAIDSLSKTSRNFEGRPRTVVRNVLDANNTIAEKNRKLFKEKQVFVFNVMSSPGSGKTTTLVKTISEIIPDIPCAVIVGDICTSNDAIGLLLPVCLSCR